MQDTIRNTDSPETPGIWVKIGISAECLSLTFLLPVFDEHCNLYNENIMVRPMNEKISSIMQKSNEKLVRRMNRSIARMEIKTGKSFDEFSDSELKDLLRRRPFRQAVGELEMKEKLENDTTVLGEGEGILTFLLDEFEDFEAKSDAWSLSGSKNMLTRKIKVLLKRNPVDRFSILNGRAGKFVWIQYRDEDDVLGDGGVASGNIEDNPIHYDGMVFDDINYSKIAFSFIPVDDF